MLKNCKKLILLIILMFTMGYSQSNSSKPDIFQIVVYGHINELRQILNDNPKLINARNKDGYSLLHEAVNADTTRKLRGPKVSKSIEQMDCKKVELLLDRRIDVNAKINGCGGTPLHLSADTEITELLLSRGARVNEKDKNGATPLHLAGDTLSRFFCEKMRRKGNMAKIAEKLIAHGAQVNAKDNKGRTPLDYAIECKDQELIRVLIKHGAKRGMK